MLPGWCCIAIAALELGNGDSWYHMCAFRFHFWSRKVNWNQASHVRASPVPTLYACCLTKRSCHFLFVARVGLCCWFCDFAVSFLVPPDGPKNETVKELFFCFFTKRCTRSQKWDRQAVPFLGPCLGSFFEVCCIKVAEAQRFGFNEALWLMAAGRATVPTLYACCLTKRSCHFLFVARVGLCCWFCDFAVSFLVPPDGPKNETVKELFFCFFTKRCTRSQKWDRQAVPFLGPCLGSFFEVCCIKVAEAQRFGFNEALWLMAAGRATRGALLSEAGFEKVFRTQNWVRRRKLFCRWFGFLLGQAGVHIGCCLNPVEGSFLLFHFVWWLDCLLLKEGASAFCSLRWLLEVFLAVEEFAGFRKGGRLPFEWLYWILYCPLLAPLAPLDSYRSLQPRKNINYDLFSQSRY